MSGILGAIQIFGHGLESGRFQAMLDSMHLRGPDADGLWQDKGVQLGHRMLVSSPEAHVEKLPFHGVESQCVITSDARLDNRQALIESLGRNSFKMDEIPDSLLVLRAYLKWGSGCVHHLLGDFAFAIWDIKEQKLFCARDFLGVKPFNYCSMGGMFLFCSETRPIAKYSGLSFTVNEARIADSFTPHLEGYDTTSTFYKEIFRLPAAHTLELKAGDVRINRYWNPEPQKTGLYKNDGDYIEALTEILTCAVTDRCRGEQNPAILLSGGVDSATVMGVAKKHCHDVSGGAVQSYSGISEDIKNCKETRLISLLSNGADITPHLYTPKDLGNHIDEVFELLAQLGEPFDVHMVLQFLLYQQAAKNGKRFMLDGVDGDVAASLSYSYPVFLLQQLSFKAAWYETSLQCRDFWETQISFYRKLVQYFLSAFTPQVIKNLRCRYRLPGLVKGYLNDSAVTAHFAKEVKMQERLINFYRNQRKQNLSYPYGVYLNGVNHTFLAVGIERYNRVASICSIEPRHPLLDKRLIEFFKDLPWNQFMREGWSKFLLRRVAETYLPKDVCWRTGQEHVGAQFHRKIRELKQDKILEQINHQYDTLKRIVRQEFMSNRSESNCYNKESTHTAVRSDVVGLTLWLNSR